jgi:Flp pilus assembly protein CpaB
LVSVANAEDYLLQNVPILAIGQSTAQSSASGGATTTATNSGLYTFGVKPSDAQRIALAEQQNLGIYLLLVPPDNPVVSVPAVDPGSILNGPQTSG